MSDTTESVDFPLVEAGGQAAAICVSASEDKAVRRAAEDLAADIERVSGVRPAIVTDLAATAAQNGGNAVVVIRTLGRGDSEAWTAQTASSDDTGGHHKHQLTITGNDRRGTIYGIYTLSESIGVSPWYWWADVPVAKHASLAIRAGEYTQHAPAVRYRGIFLNDEDWGLRPWAARTLDPQTGNIGPKTYAKVFELLLRLKANTLWPAMHEHTPAFNSFPDDAKQADDYGIIMGSSHCEQMLRDNIDEWKPATDGEYNYFTNKTGVLRFWEERVRSNAKFESVFTMGMRGIHDSGMPGGRDQREKAAKLLEIVNDQRGLLSRYVNPDLERVPQIFCPYKEVLALYRLAPDYPPDITLVWPDDNFGYVRQFSSEKEQKRSGGAGVYYHISYWGAPHDYLWLNTTPPALIWEEMTKAWAYGARRFWIVNVGDLKPGELGMEYFLRLAWDPEAAGPDDPDALMAASLKRDFGPENAEEITAILRGYYRFNWNRKPEFLEPALVKGVYSTMRHGVDEISRRLDEGEQLVRRADALESKLPPESRAAYYQLVLYPVRCAVAMNKKWLDLTRYDVYAKQGRAQAGDLLKEARGADETIHRETAYYNDTLSGGKWRWMMSDHPRDRGVFKFPEPAPPPPPLPEKGVLGVALEESDPVLMEGKAGSGRLPQFSREIGGQSFPIDVFNGGQGALRWSATADVPWIQLSQTTGKGDARVMVSVDWTKAPESGAAGTQGHGAIHFRDLGAVGTSAPDLLVEVSEVGGGTGDVAHPNSAPSEDNGRVAIRPRAGQAAGGGPAWKAVQGLGTNGEALAVFPVAFRALEKPELIPAESPVLRQPFSIRTPGKWTVELRTLPTWPVVAGRAQRYAVSVDDAPPVVVSLPLYGEESNKRWQQDIMRNAALTESVHQIATPGAHVLNVWAVDPGVVLDGITLFSTSQ